MNLTLDKTIPAIAEAFTDCKPGDMYKVVSSNDESVVLEPVAADADADDETEETPPAKKPRSTNPAIEKLIGE